MVAEFDPSPAELELLVEACRTLDELDALRQTVARDGVTAQGSRGQLRSNPALVHLRQSRAELRRLLDALAVPAPPNASSGEADDVGVLSLTARRAQKAARARWADRGASHA